MMFDRILEDSLGYIRRMLWSKEEDKPTKQAFRPTRTVEGEFGFVHLLEGRDTPRAVRTWMFTPKRQNLNSAQMVATSTPMDLHLYVDFLEPLPESTSPKAKQEKTNRQAQRLRGEDVKTHRIQVLKASHFLNKSGFYDYELIFWKDYDFWVSNRLDANKVAARLLDRLAERCLKIATPLKLKSEAWEEVVDALWNEMKEQLKQMV